MTGIKDVAKTMNVKQFNERFIKENQGIRDIETGKLHFCMHDFGFDFDQVDCLATKSCEVCYKESMDYLEFREKQKIS